MAETQKPTVFLSWLLKELWNYWSRTAGVTVSLGEYCFLWGAWKAGGHGRIGGCSLSALLGPEATRLWCGV